MEKIGKSIRMWSQKRLAGIFIFNLAVTIMVLLNTAQYFKPFFYLGINTIFFISLFLAIVLLGARTKAIFIISIIFLLFAAVLKLAGIDVWADRASIYFYQSFFVGFLLLLFSKS